MKARLHFENKEPLVLQGESVIGLYKKALAGDFLGTMITVTTNTGATTINLNKTTHIEFIEEDHSDT